MFAMFLPLIIKFSIVLQEHFLLRVFISFNFYPSLHSICYPSCNYRIAFHTRQHNHWGYNVSTTCALELGYNVSTTCALELWYNVSTTCAIGPNYTLLLFFRAHVVSVHFPFFCLPSSFFCYFNITLLFPYASVRENTRA